MKSVCSKGLCLIAASSVMGGSALVLMTGCKGLDYSAGAEGTGVQIIGAIVVLAKYNASNQQKAVAEQVARATFVAAAKPAYEKKRSAVQRSSKERAGSVEGSYRKRIAQSKSRASSAADPGKSENLAQIEADKKQALEKLQKEAAAELASVDTAWRTLNESSGRLVSGADSTPSGSVPLASTRDLESLIASAEAHLPSYIAVPVPARGIDAERGSKAIVMLWDTRRQKLASDEVLVLDRKPAVGIDAKLDGVTARIAGN